MWLWWMKINRNPSILGRLSVIKWRNWTWWESYLNTRISDETQNVVVVWLQWVEGHLCPPPQKSWPRHNTENIIMAIWIFYSVVGIGDHRNCHRRIDPPWTVNTGANECIQALWEKYANDDIHVSASGVFQLLQTFKPLTSSVKFKDIIVFCKPIISRSWYFMSNICDQQSLRCICVSRALDIGTHLLFKTLAHQ